MRVPDDHPGMASPSTAMPDGRPTSRSASVVIPSGDADPPLTAPAPDAPSVSPDLLGTKVKVAPVIRAKIEPPQLRNSTLSRGRLLKALNSAISRRVTLLIAEAGYGKTTLLTDFSSRPIARCLWYKLDSTDRDWVTMVNYLVAAVRELWPGFGERTTQLLSADPTSIVPRDAVLSSLLAELQSLPDEPAVLILDDFQAIDESEEACAVVMHLVRNAPVGFRFILASRRQPPLLLAKLAAMGELSEIGTDDLRFSRGETERLFAEGYGRPLAPDVLEEIDARTKGWAATLQLVNSSIRGKSESAVRSLARSISGGEGRLYDFLAEEVLSQLPAPLQDFVRRAALLADIMPEYVVPLFAEGGEPSQRVAEAWIEEADGLGILSRSSQTSPVRQFHPLFREFLLRQLAQRFGPAEVRRMHARVARVAARRDPLLACHHYLEAGEMTEAMHSLGTSAMLTMGSGRWGTASELIGRLHDVPAEPVVAAIQARRLLEDGDVASAAAMLEEVDLSAESPAVRAVFRHTQLSLGWRSRDGEAVFATLREIEHDVETPPLLREIAEVFVDASPLSSRPVTFLALSQRLQRMAERQTASGHTYHAAISLHNAAIAELNAARYTDAIRVATLALEAFDGLVFSARERHSTHPILAACALEVGRLDEAEDEIRVALASGFEDADVHASCAHSLAVIGERERSTRLLLSAEALERQGRSDLQAATIALLTKGFLQLAVSPSAAIAILEATEIDSPLDLGFNLEHHTLVALAHLLQGDREGAQRAAEGGLVAARVKGGLRSEHRLLIVHALARQDGADLRASMAHAASSGQLAILEVADALGENLDLLGEVPEELSESIGKWKGRWLPILRRQLGRGNVPGAHVAARLLDEHGTLDDVARLRAFEKSYVKRTRAVGLGKALARRVSHRLEIRDLGRVVLRVGERYVPLSRIRRKPASLLMYLVTKPNFTATREQVLDELWPESDPVSAMNSLNQSLYFIRREIDPWYEDDVSADYVAYEGELLWLDPTLVRAESAEFLSEARGLLSGPLSGRDALAFVDRYMGQFSPDFEYEEWAMPWRSRVHASFLDFAHAAVSHLSGAGDLNIARDVAARALLADPTASDIEQKLIWLYWRLGATSAASAQYQHFVTRHRSDGLEAPTLAEMTSDLLSA
ncbi:BTAD domain-containing putative transcriptional regulator [soil metagenome]